MYSTTIENQLASFFFHNFSKPFYELVSKTEGKEEIYYRKNKMAVVVEDETIGKQLYEVVKKLSEAGTTIITQYWSFKIRSYVVDRENKIALIFLNVELSLAENWSEFEDLEKLIAAACMEETMRKEGYYLDKTKFDMETANCFSTFLSFFSTNSEHQNSSQGTLIRYIHYVLSNGGNLEDFYQKIVQENVPIKVSEFPYRLAVIKMCYRYFISGSVEGEIDEILRRERNLQVGHIEESDFLNDCWIVSNPNLATSLKVIEKTAEYVAYEGCIKIYHHVSSEFEAFLKAVKEHDFYNLQSQLQEKVKILIIDFTGHIIGYQFAQKKVKFSPIFEKASSYVSSQIETINFVRDLSKYILSIEEKSSYFNFDNEDLFDIQRLLVSDTLTEKRFRFDNVQDLFYFFKTDKADVKKHIASVFLRLYVDLLQKKYGEISNEQELWKKEEVRYLSPVLASQVVNCVIRKKLSSNETTQAALLHFLDTKLLTDSGYFYDSGFQYNRQIVPFAFDDEIKEKYGVQLKTGEEQLLPNGSRLITYKRSQSVTSVKERIEKRKESIFKYIGNITTGKVEIVDICEVIYAKDLNEQGQYQTVGIITTPIRGTQISTKVLLSLNNRDLSKVMYCLLSNFDRYSIPWQNIWMDKNADQFYINIFGETEYIVVENECTTSQEYLEQFINSIEEQGYNPYACEYWRTIIQTYGWEKLLELINGNYYCKEHNIYYFDEKGDKLCPICRKTKCRFSNSFLTKLGKVWEDEIAIHYAGMGENKGLIFKIYKQMEESQRSEMEAKMNLMLLEHLKSGKNDLGQECFVPCKKVVDKKNKFLGYAYEKVDFRENEQNSSNKLINLEDTENLRNLPRVKALIRLILQVQELIKQGLYFTRDPFQSVFLSKAHKRQVQILNIEFLGRDGSIEDTVEWTYEYVCKVVNKDSFIEVDFSQCPQDLSSILDALQVFAQNMTKYCSTHKAYYSKYYLFCPWCVGVEQMRNMEVGVSEISTKDQEPINEGGESFIYPYQDGQVAKVFKDQEVDLSFKSIVLARVFGRKKVLEELDSQNSKYQYVIPQKVLVDESRNIIGYTMKKVQKGMPLSTLRDKNLVEKLGFTRKDILEILIAVGEGIEVLHSKANMYIGDLNGRNILFDADKTVYFLEFDGMGIDEIAPMFCTDGYIDPVSKKNNNISMEDDWYSYAIQAFYYLTLTHPFNGMYYERDSQKALDITEKMEHKISLLGNHGMNPPEVAIPWDWMAKELQNAFLTIFEGNNRESIVPYLKRQYLLMYGGGIEKKTFLVNPKFAATLINPFQGDTVRILNHYAAVCEDVNNYYVGLITQEDGKIKQRNLHFPLLMDLQEVMLSDDGQIAFVIYPDKVTAYDTKRSVELYSETLSDMTNFVVNGRTLYFTGINSSGEDIIFQILFNGEAQCQKIKFLPQQRTKKLLVRFNSKFVLVKQGDEGIDTIYCNSERLCDMQSKPNTQYNILYDDVTKMWLVVSTTGEYITLQTSNPGFNRFSFPSNIVEDIRKSALENMYFSKGKIYIPGQDVLHIISLLGGDQVTIKEMECHKIMTPTSRIYSITPSGFKVLSNHILYEVHKVKMVKVK